MTAAERWQYLDEAAVHIEKLIHENAEYEECANLMLDALLLIQDNAGKPLGGIYGVADQSWCAGVVMGALSSLEERAAAWKRRHSTLPRFLPRSLGGEADRTGARL